MKTRTAHPHRTASVRRMLIAALLLALPASALAAPWSSPWTRQHFATRNSNAKTLSKQLLGAWDQRYAAVGRTAGSMLASDRPDRYAMRVYLLERELVDMLQFVDRSQGVTPRQREVVSRDIISRLGQLQHSYTTIQSTMRAQQEAAAPGGTGGTLVQPVTTRKGTVDAYHPSKGKRLQDVRAKRAKEHPGEDPYFCLNRKTIKDVKSGELLEFGAMLGGQLRVTRFAKHLDVCGGNPAQSSGGTKIFWSESSKRRKAILAYGSNWSGTYQSNMATLADTLLPRFDKLGIDRNVVVFTGSMPLSTKMYETLLETRGMDKKVVKQRCALLERAADVRTKRFEQSWSAAIAGTAK